MKIKIACNKIYKDISYYKLYKMDTMFVFVFGPEWEDIEHYSSFEVGYSRLEKWIKK
jgi:hypothetical protein